MADDFYPSDKLSSESSKKIVEHIHPACYCPVCFYKAEFVNEGYKYWFYVCPICGVDIAMRKGTADGNSDYQF